MNSLQATCLRPLVYIVIRFIFFFTKCLCIRPSNNNYILLLDVNFFFLHWLSGLLLYFVCIWSQCYKRAFFLQSDILPNSGSARSSPVMDLASPPKPEELPITEDKPKLVESEVSFRFRFFFFLLFRGSQTLRIATLLFISSNWYSDVKIKSTNLVWFICLMAYQPPVGYLMSKFDSFINVWLQS